MRLMGRLVRTVLILAVAILAVRGALSLLVPSYAVVVPAETRPPAAAVLNVENGALFDNPAERPIQLPDQFPEQVGFQASSPAVAAASHVKWAQMFLLVPLVLLVALPLVGVVLVAGRIMRASRCSNDEAELLQGINEGLQRMERRIEALETLVVDDRAVRPAGRP